MCRHRQSQHRLGVGKSTIGGTYSSISPFAELLELLETAGVPLVHCADATSAAETSHGYVTICPVTDAEGADVGGVKVDVGR